MVTKVMVDGTTFGFSAAQPATHDQAGFEALTFTAQAACDIVDAGNLGDSWTEVSDNTLCTAGAGTRKGKRQFGSTDVVLKYGRADAAQAILQTAFENQNDFISVEETLSNGDIRYYEAQVGNYEETRGTSGSEVEVAVSLWRQTTHVEVDGT